MSKETYLQGLSWVAARQLVAVPACQILNVYMMVLIRFRYIQHLESHHHISILGLYPGAASGNEELSGIHIPW